ncbi:hypothetical protein FY528_09010 [Hymenobacter lutimineralis]|uniref:AAA family ATPase n=1 Tax=Hymenobacter lutimineralis TaxID=2606448 RepID=A0A5D6V3F6_9BACT|nr:hypothetical protein [Hymenobacter lutimineralis]TYZ10591.1 hypothetical protein FY528_09010 [Hymenobacter lutimineralis]
MLPSTAVPAAPTPTALTLLNLQQRLAAEAQAAAGPAPPSSRLADILALGQQVRQATEQPVTFRPALLWQDGEPVFWPSTVNLIQGPTGAHKSRIAELIGSAIIARGGQLQGDALGLEFRPAPGEQYRLLYIDTERNLSDQLPFAIQSLKGRAGYGFTEHPPELDYTSLVMLPRAERFPTLVEYLAHHRAGFEGHLIVVLDVLSDCVADFNDVVASLALMDMLNVAVNEQNATIIGVIHENPGTTTSKARGHLGTEATNKASTVLQIGYVKEGGRPTPLIQLSYLKRRYGAPGLAFFATYDEETKGLVRADQDLAAGYTANRSAGAPRKVSVANVLSALPELLVFGPMRAGELADALVQHLGIGIRTAKAYLTELVQPGAGYVQDSQGRTCQLSKSKAAYGPSVLYSLEPISPPKQCLVQ